MRLPALLPAAALALVATMPSAAPLPPVPLTVTLTAAAGSNPSAPRMGDRLTFHSIIRNDGKAPIEGVIGWISLVRVDPGEEQSVDLEDWSTQKAVAAARLAPDDAIETDWPMRLIQAGRYRIAVSVIARGSAAMAASPFCRFHGPQETGG